MLKKNCLYERLRDRLGVVTLEDERPIKQTKGFYGRHNGDWIPVRYVKSGRKGYLKVDDLSDVRQYSYEGQIDPTKVWESSPMVGARAPDTVMTAAAEHDLREREIRKHRKAIIEGRFYDKQPSQNAISALEQAIHMILAGV